MNDRHRKYIQKERIAAVDEFINEFSNYMCNVRRMYKPDAWQSMMTKARLHIYKERDLNRDHMEPLNEGCHCACFANGRTCSSLAVKDGLCSKHDKKMNN